MSDVNIDTFAQQINVMHKRLDQMYQGTNTSVPLPPQLLPLAFKELGIAAEELQVAVEELQQQNEELADARKKLAAERQRYKELFEFAPNGYLVINELGMVEEANRAAAELLNLEQRFLVGKPLLIFVAKSERQAFQLQLNWLQQAKGKHELAVRLCPRNGEPFETALTVSAVNNWEGKPIVHVCVRDINDGAHTKGRRKQVAAGLEISDYDFTKDRSKHIYLKGEIIPLKPQAIWQVTQGIVKLSTMSENGSEVLVGLAGPSMLFGSNLTELNTYQATALSKVELVCFSLSEVAASPSLTQTLLPQIIQRLRQTECLLAISGHRHVKDRFYQLLQLLKQEIGQPVEQGICLSVRFTHQDFTDACSTTRVTITRLLGKLQQQRDIIIDPTKHIIITN